MRVVIQRLSLQKKRIEKPCRIGGAFVFYWRPPPGGRGVGLVLLVGELGPRWPLLLVPLLPAPVPPVKLLAAMRLVSSEGS